VLKNEPTAGVMWEVKKGEPNLGEWGTVEDLLELTRLDIVTSGKWRNPKRICPWERER